MAKIQKLRLSFGSYFLITYASQKKNPNTIKPALLKTVCVKQSPVSFLLELRESSDDLEFSIINSQQITRREYKYWKKNGGEQC